MAVKKIVKKLTGLIFFSERYQGCEKIAYKRKKYFKWVPSRKNDSNC